MTRFIPASIVATLLASLAFAQSTDETRCRSSASVYTASSNGHGTVTGFSTDLVLLHNSEGKLISCFPISYWCQPGRPQVREVVFHSSGQISIRFDYAVFTNNHPKLKGGTVSITTSSGHLIDCDRLI